MWRKKVVQESLSPDPNIQDPTSSQGLNRYSYCYGNPLMYTDPDGENPLLLIGLIIWDIGINMEMYGEETNNQTLCNIGNIVSTGGSILTGFGGLPLLPQMLLNSSMAGFNTALNGGSFEKGFVQTALPSAVLYGLNEIGNIHWSENCVATGRFDGSVMYPWHVRIKNLLPVFNYLDEHQSLLSGISNAIDMNLLPKSKLLPMYTNSTLEFNGNSLELVKHYDDGSISIGDCWHAQSGPFGCGRLPNGPYTGNNLRIRTDNPGMMKYRVGFSMDLTPPDGTDIIDDNGIIRNQLRIHPMGGNGTEGCIGIIDNHAGLMRFYNEIHNYLNRFHNITVNVYY